MCGFQYLRCEQSERYPSSYPFREAAVVTPTDLYILKITNTLRSNIDSFVSVSMTERHTHAQSCFWYEISDFDNSRQISARFRVDDIFVSIIFGLLNILGQCRIDPRLVSIIWLSKTFIQRKTFILFKVILAV